MAACMRTGQLVVNEPRVKVDLKQYTERHVFAFDAVLDENVDNDEVYRCRPRHCPQPAAQPRSARTQPYSPPSNNSDTHYWAIISYTRNFEAFASL